MPLMSLGVPVRAVSQTLTRRARTEAAHAPGAASPAAAFSKALLNKAEKTSAPSKFKWFPSCHRASSRGVSVKSRYAMPLREATALASRRNASSLSGATACRSGRESGIETTTGVAPQERTRSMDSCRMAKTGRSGVAAGRRFSLSAFSAMSVNAFSRYFMFTRPRTPDGRNSPAIELRHALPRRRAFRRSLNFLARTTSRQSAQSDPTGRMFAGSPQWKRWSIA